MSVAPGQLLRHAPEIGRGADVARQHLDAAGETLPRSDGGADAMTFREGVVLREHVDSLEGRLPIFARSLHVQELPRALSQPFGYCLSGGCRAHPAPGLGRQVNGTLAHAQGTHPLCRDRRGATNRSRAHVLPLAHPDEQDARGRTWGIDQRRLVALAAEVAGGPEPLQGAARGSVQLRERARETAPRKDDRQHRRLEAGGCGSNDGGLERHGDE